VYDILAQKGRFEQVLFSSLFEGSFLAIHEEINTITIQCPYHYIICLLAG